MFRFLVLFLFSFHGVFAMDHFNYRKTVGNDFAPPDWGQVSCLNVETCPGWPTNWENLNDFIPYRGSSNMCRDCSATTSGVCLRHKQSPIRLYKGVTADRECNDRHKMRIWLGNCRLDTMKFEILPHVLRAYQPDVCPGVDQPAIDFSRGFPAQWMLEFTDIHVPSQHFIDGVQYDAEITLSHTYAVDKGDRLIGNVSIMLQKGSLRDNYDFLDLYLRKWEEEANKIHIKCFGEGISYVESAYRGPINDDGPLHYPQFRDDTSVGQWITKDHYNRTWHPYDWYVKANTEYYFRYEGSMTEPPCFEGVHWRVLKDPIKVNPSQLRRLNALIKNRVNPETCDFDTAAAPKFVGAVNQIRVNRPLQTSTGYHRMFFCECVDWTSKSLKDLAYCAKSIAERGVEEFAGVHQESSMPSPSPSTDYQTTAPAGLANDFIPF